MKRADAIRLGVVALVVGSLVGAFFFLWNVDETSMRAKGWGVDPAAALAAAKTANRPVFVKLGSHH
jgi:hypothetical protein